MISGQVRSNEAQIRLKLHGPNGQTQEISAIVDTGYTGELTLPPGIIAHLGLQWRSADAAVLADGNTCHFDVYEATVDWDGDSRDILVDEADTDPLIGMQLLAGYELKMQVRQRGKVTIKRLPRR
jgi:clan AA aspartic protease